MNEPTEMECGACGFVPKHQRRKLRAGIETFPLDPEAICDECLSVWRRLRGINGRAMAAPQVRDRHRAGFGRFVQTGIRLGREPICGRPARCKRFFEELWHVVGCCHLSGL